MRVKLEPETAFIGKKFAYIFLGIIFVLNSLVFIWYFFFSNLTLSSRELASRDTSKLFLIFFKIYSVFKRKNQQTFDF